MEAPVNLFNFWIVLEFLQILWRYNLDLILLILIPLSLFLFQLLIPFFQINDSLFELNFLKFHFFNLLLKAEDEGGHFLQTIVILQIFSPEFKTTSLTFNEFALAQLLMCSFSDKVSHDLLPAVYTFDKSVGAHVLQV